MKRLAMVVSHPIQYQAPLFRRLAVSEVVDLEVLFLDDHGVRESFDPGYGRAVRYDVPLLDGYEHRFVPNRALRPAIHGFTGLVHPALVGLIRSGAYDAVAVHGYAHASDWIAFAAAAAAGVPYLLRGETQGPTPAYRRSARWLLRSATVGTVVRGAAGLLAIGRRNADFYLSLGAARNRVGWAPYSVDNAWFAERGAQGREERADRLRRLGLDPGRPVVVFAAKLLPRKRVGDVIGALDVLGGEASLLVIGDGEQRGLVAEAARSRAWLRALGFVNQEEIARWYGVADVVVLPSDYETWGLAVNEAMAAGAVPVVSEAVGCGSDLVEGGAGRVFPTGDVEALASALRDVVEPARLAAARREVSRRIARYDVAETARGFEDAVARI